MKVCLVCTWPSKVDLHLGVEIKRGEEMKYLRKIDPAGGRISTQRILHIVSHAGICSC